MPGGEPPNLLRRFELCAASLDARCLERQMPIHTPLHDCQRDTLALAAAMQPAQALVLTPVDEGEPPALCKGADDAGIDVCGLDVPVHSAPVRDALLPLSGGTQRYALVHVVAPAALILPEPIEGADDLMDDDYAEAIGGQLWDGASLLWQELTLS